MELILRSIISRVQRDHKVELCHFTWMANHVHQIVVSKDAVECTRFYGEVQKQITEAVKRLFGLKYLNLWKSNAASVVRLQGVSTIKKRIAYLYANPAQAHLVSSIDKYPGFSSWGAFNSVSDDINYVSSSVNQWIRIGSIPKLAMFGVTPKYDSKLTSQLINSNKKRKSHELLIRPNAWIRACGITDEFEVHSINHGIRELLKKYEDAARNRRNRKKLKLLGVNHLVSKPITLNYLPEKASRRIFVYAADKDTRIRMILAYKEFCQRCDECYQRWKLGDYLVTWPPGAFFPPAPPRSNWLED